MREYTKAFNTSAKCGFDSHTWNKVENHKATYRVIRESSKLPISLVQGARDCACEALKALKCNTIPYRKPLAAMRYNQRVITVNMLHGIATIATTDGRVKASFFVPDNYKLYLGWSMRSSTLSYRGDFYLHVSVETANPAVVSDVKVLGIDRGINHIAVCSGNVFFNSKAVKNVRAKYAKLRRELQSKGTRSAHRKLKLMSGRERRFVTNLNHCIAYC
ncbi:MAG TPA: transposase [Methanocella sp.]|nr:transposase [Methanocella sp.]